MAERSLRGDADDADAVVGDELFLPPRCPRDLAPPPGRAPFDAAAVPPRRAIAAEQASAAAINVADASMLPDALAAAAAARAAAEAAPAAAAAIARWGRSTASTAARQRASLRQMDLSQNGLALEPKWLRRSRP